MVRKSVHGYEKSIVAMTALRIMRQSDGYCPPTQAIASPGKDTTLRRKALSNAAGALPNAAMYSFFSRLYH